jgi:hypothetical protein
MTSKLVVLVTAVGCIGAAGVGSYLAVRSAPASEAAGRIELTRPSPEPTELVTTGRPPAEAQVTRNLNSRRAPAATEIRAGGTPAGRPAATAEAAQENPTESTPVPEVVPAPEAAKTEPVDSGAGWPAVETTGAPPAPAVNQPIEDVVVAADSVLGIRVETPVSSATSRVEDRVSGRLTRDLSVDGRTVIPAGAQVVGHVSVVDRGGRVRERARLGVRFTSIVLDEHVRISIQTDTVYREGDPPATEATAKIGASAVIGGIIGGVFGGKRGAAIGSAAGAAGGTAVVMTGDRNSATLPAGSTLSLRLSEPITVQVEKR